jgi:hypothetical protein
MDKDNFDTMTGGNYGSYDDFEGDDSDLWTSAGRD